MTRLAPSTLQPLFALIAGTLFGLGLAVSGMVDPARVLAFLDVAGRWDPTLALVMLGALAVTTPGFRIALRRPRPWFGEAFALPTKRDIEPRLLTGAVLFGVGWGIAGLCPGPAIADLVTGSSSIVTFVVAMIAGMGLHDALERSRSRGSGLRGREVTGGRR